MILFTSQDWFVSLMLVGVFVLIMAVPCAVLAVMGRRMFERLGFHPSQAPLIQIKFVGPLIFLELFAFLSLLGFYKLFQAS